MHAELGRLWAEGRGESPEADEIRDRSDGPWLAMTGEERAAYQGKTPE